jgi:hypothetical protein
VSGDCDRYAASPRRGGSLKLACPVRKVKSCGSFCAYLGTGVDKL